MSTPNTLLPDLVGQGFIRLCSPSPPRESAILHLITSHANDQQQVLAVACSNVPSLKDLSTSDQALRQTQLSKIVNCAEQTANDSRDKQIGQLMGEWPAIIAFYFLILSGFFVLYLVCWKDSDWYDVVVHTIGIGTTQGASYEGKPIAVKLISSLQALVTLFYLVGVVSFMMGLAASWLA